MLSSDDLLWPTRTWGSATLLWRWLVLIRRWSELHFVVFVVLLSLRRWSELQLVVFLVSVRRWSELHFVVLLLKKIEWTATLFRRDHSAGHQCSTPLQYVSTVLSSCKRKVTGFMNEWVTLVCQWKIHTMYIFRCPVCGWPMCNSKCAKASVHRYWIGIAYYRYIYIIGSSLQIFLLPHCWQEIYIHLACCGNIQTETLFSGIRNAGYSRRRGEKLTPQIGILRSHK